MTDDAARTAPLANEDFWQEVMPEGTYELAPQGGHKTLYPAVLPDGRQLALPIRPRDGGRSAFASLIINQASFAVVETLAKVLAEKLARYEADIVIGLPTLGLTLAAETAKALGHARYVPFSTSRKFWYNEEQSVALSSVTSPTQKKRLYADPRMLPLIEGKRVLLIDDVLSSGASIKAGLSLLTVLGVRPVAIGAAMLQTELWQDVISAYDPDMLPNVEGVFTTPLLRPTGEGGWL